MERAYELTEEQKEKYLRSPDHCPVCQSDDIEGGFVEVDCGGAWQNIHCIECGARWADLYMLDAIVDVHVEVREGQDVERADERTAGADSQTVQDGESAG